MDRPQMTTSSVAQLCGGYNKYLSYFDINCSRRLAEATGIGIIRSAHGGRYGAGLADDDFGLDGGGGDLGGGCCTGEGEDDDESADDDLHVYYPESGMYFCDISLDDQMK